MNVVSETIETIYYFGRYNQKEVVNQLIPLTDSELEQIYNKLEEDNTKRLKN